METQPGSIRSIPSPDGEVGLESCGKTNDDDDDDDNEN